MKILISYILFYLLSTYLFAQNEHIYKQLSNTYLVEQFPFTAKIPISNPLMRFQDSILVDIYYYQTYENSKYCLANKKDTTTLFEYSFKQEGWYQIFVFTKQGLKLYQTSVLLLYKPQKNKKNILVSNTKSIEFDWAGESIAIKNDTTVVVHKKKRNYELDVFCTIPNLQSDTLYVNVYKIEKKEEGLFCQWKIIKSENRYQTQWIIKRKDLGKYRFSVFDTKKYWYGSKEIEIQESK